MRVLCRRCRRVFGSHCGIDDIGGSTGPRAWRRAWSRRWPRTRSWLGARSWPRLGHCRPGLLLQPALGPRDLPVLIAFRRFSQNIEEVRRFAGAPLLFWAPMVFHRRAFQFKSDASRKPFRRATPISSRAPEPQVQGGANAGVVASVGSRSRPGRLWLDRLCADQR